MEYSITIKLGIEQEETREFRCVSESVLRAYIDGMAQGIEADLDEDDAYGGCSVSGATSSMEISAKIAGYGMTAGYKAATIVQCTLDGHVGMQFVVPSLAYLLDDQENPNDNCLSGWQCPVCESYGPFRVAAQTEAMLFDDGTDDYARFEYEDDAPCTCSDCGHKGEVIDFIPNRRVKLLSLLEQVEIAKRAGKFDNESLDDLVQDACLSHASAINNDGYDQQVRFLYTRGYADPDEIKRAIQAA